MSIDHDLCNDALRRAGSNWSAAQAHGLLTGQLAIGGAAAAPSWTATVLESTDVANAAVAEAASMLAELAENSHRHLRERLSAFEPLLADDAADVAARTQALSDWAEGFLHGLVSAQHAEELRARLAADPIAGIIKDMLEITRVEAPETDSDDDDAAYTEIVEYLRVAAQLVYEELADHRNKQ